MEKFKIFKEDPFDPRLGIDQINQLSARFRTTIYPVKLAGNLRAIFRLDGEVVTSLDIGTHDIYK
jgi:hypothetical protein